MRRRFPFPFVQAMHSIVMEHSIAAVPTFVAYKGAERQGAFSGADRAELRRLVEQLGKA